MHTKKNIVIRIVLTLAGIFIILSGLNIGLGGMLTLGWGGQSNFFSVTDWHSYMIQDSHTRFVGGVWFGVGLFFLFASADVIKHRSNLYFAFALIFLGGMMRLFQMHPEVTFRLPILASLTGELIGMPLMCLWLSKIK